MLNINEIGQAMKNYEPSEDEIEAETRTEGEIIEDIIEAFKQDEETWNACIEELDSYNGYLGDSRYYEMSDLDEIYHDQEPTEILFRAFYGYDATYGSSDRREAFNPNREYFYYNGYGNLVSSDWKDYSDQLDAWAIRSMSENRHYVDSIEDNSVISALFDELEEVEG